MRMRRTLALLLVPSALITLLSADAEAARKRKPKPKAAAAAAEAKAPAANTRAVSELMGPFKWGMTEKQVVDELGKQIEARYAEQIKETSDVYKQDSLRKKAAAEKKRVAQTIVKFNGQPTGWDVSIIDKEFGHKNDESLLEYWENDPQTNKDQRRYFFFVDGKLWKMFIAFNAELFQGKRFVDFAQIMMERYGKAAVGESEDTLFVFWRSGTYYLRAIDLTKFYGNFCIAISNDDIERTIYARREERNPKPKKANSIVDSVTEGANSPPASANDPNADVIDRLTGGK